MKTVYTCELDIAHCLNFSEFCDFLHKHKLQLMIKEPVGPAGGNPLVVFIAPSFFHLLLALIEMEVNLDSENIDIKKGIVNV